MNTVSIYVKDAKDKSGKVYKLCHLEAEENVTVEDAYAAGQDFLDKTVDDPENRTDYYICKLEFSDGHNYEYDRKDRGVYLDKYLKWAAVVAV